VCQNDTPATEYLIMKNTYNVVCITTRSPGGKDALVAFHLPPLAPTVTEEDGKVEYNGKTYSLKCADKGLSGKAFVLVMDDGGGLLELYTDTPVTGTDATSESIRKEARMMIVVAQLKRENRFEEMIVVASGKVDPDTVKMAKYGSWQVF
jgi:hypothetical protein